MTFERFISSIDYAAKRFSVYAACHCYAANYHTGQWSRAYRLLCSIDRKGFRPGLAYGIDEDATREDPVASTLLDKLIERSY